ncbi:flagellar basal-body rod protein FlgC [Escherichia coli]|uniref:Flagellar basal-body rod protein FlgC n=1 Tax=Escherichia coli TaxID=562 RepID=A0A376UBU8_ECOLX|nr:flagellar basal-body rod protein FlgC [Escherichia coli]
MALLNIFDIAGSALTAQSQRLNVAASNLANADSVTGPDGQPYRAKQVVFQVNAAPGAATGGVKVADVIESQAPDKLVYEPGNPLADAKGYVKMPNVDVVGEMVNTMSASRSYQANVEVLNTVKSMMLKPLRSVNKGESYVHCGNHTDPTNTGVSTTSSSSLTGSNAADLQSSFLTLLVAQLKNQDPTNPMETTS